MAVFKKYEPKNERELHSIIEDDLDALEEGLHLLRHEMGLGRSYPDFLCVDSGRRLAVIEVKHREDENILFQGLRYYSDIDRRRHEIANIFPGHRINAKEHPRVILIAEKFSDDISRLSALVIPDVELHEYSVLENQAGERGLHYHRVSLPPVEEAIVEPATVAEHVGYITKEELKPLLETIRGRINSIGDDVQEYPTQRYLGYRRKGRQFAWIEPHRKSFDVGAQVIDDKGRVLDYPFVRIDTPDTAYSDIMETISTSYHNLGR